METKNNLLISTSPHIHSPISTTKIMWIVALCLLPAGVWGVFNFGINSLFIVLASVVSALLTEFIITRLLGRFTLLDGSAFLTGLLIGYNMPPDIPAFIPVLASVFAIAVVKQTFGGLGRNFMNPALAGRVFALFCWTEDMTRWSPSMLSASDAFTGATPLSQGPAEFLSKSGSYLDLFLGNISGCIGEVSVLLLLVGAAVLFLLRIITWEIPAAYIGTFIVFAWVFGGLTDGGGFFRGDVLFHTLSGGLMLGAFFMATDMVTSPLTRKGMIIFGVGCGFFTFIIRFLGGLPEGVSLAIILMNITVPLINKFSKPVKFGLVRDNNNEAGK
ncbi:MAG: RnfABCDGE type electron transport complex subunit D [Spirochaetales bacterium]|nr:RnfABCDGE type electron transport complex subunit D [Spirochaetales bacterium]